MKRQNDQGTKARLLRVMRALIERPNGYTKNDLAQMTGVDKATITRDFNDFRNAGFLLQPDGKYRYAFVVDKPYQQLKSLLHFSEEDQVLLEEAIDQISPHSQRGHQLKKKLASLYDYKRLGHTYLRKTYLTKVDRLLEAQQEKRQVILRAYRSSHGGVISDRRVEPFHASPPDDMLHAFDLDKKQLRHFRISRFRKVEILEQEWQHENHHNVMLTDPFRIVNSDQVMVHLRMGVGAYNELTERFPLTKAYLEETEENEIYDFQCMVNRRFLGLTNFILANHHFQMEILSPDELIDHLKKTVENMKF